MGLTGLNGAQATESAAGVPVLSSYSTICHCFHGIKGILKMTQSLSVQALLSVDMLQALNEEQINVWPGNQAHIDLVLSLCIP